jgi:hypothetical protein
MVDRDQTRRDAETRGKRVTEGGEVLYRPPSWELVLALLSELELAEHDAEMSAQIAFEANEREKLYEARLAKVQAELNAQKELAEVGRRAAKSADYFEARLAKVPALVEAARYFLTYSSDLLARDRLRDALAVWEQE